MRLNDFLQEANILNGDEIRSLLNDIAKNIPDPYKKRFVNTAYTEIVNDPKYHTKVTRLPPNSPDWAATALAKNELDSAEIPDENRGYFEQIVHWIQDIIKTSQISPTNDFEKEDKREAGNQLKSFLSKMSIDQMLEHTRKWFSRHSDRIKGDTSGMEKITDVGNGWAWWLLITEDAFTREGRVLDNCIGRIYTAENCKRSGTKIYMLKNKALESSLAMRIIRKNEMAEVKGHGNKLPSAFYMPMVNKFIQDNNIVVGDEGNRDLIEAGYVFDPKTRSIVHYSSIYPFEKGPEIGGGMILVKWTAPASIWTRSWQGLNYVPLYGFNRRDENNSRYDVVSPKNTYHPQASFIVNEKNIVGIGNLFSPNRVIAENGMNTLASNLANAANALGMPIPDSFNGELAKNRDPGLNRYGISVKNGKLSTDHNLAVEVSVFFNPKSIVSIKNPSERLQRAAINGDPNIIASIDNPVDEVQITAFEKCDYPHKTMNEYLSSHKEPPILAAQKIACQRDGYSIERIPDPSEEIQIEAVKQAGLAIAFLTWKARRNGKPAPSEAVQKAAFTRSIFALKYFLQSYKISPAVQLYCVKHYANQPHELEFMRDTLDRANNLDPKVAAIIDRELSKK